MSREESLEEIAFCLDSINFFKQMKRKYIDTRVAVNASMSVVLLTERLRLAVKEHKHLFGERVDIVMMESLL